MNTITHIDTKLRNQFPKPIKDALEKLDRLEACVSEAEEKLASTLDDLFFARESFVRLINQHFSADDIKSAQVQISEFFANAATV